MKREIFLIPDKKQLSCVDTRTSFAGMLMARGISFLLVGPQSGEAAILWARTGIRAEDQKYPLLCIVDEASEQGGQPSIVAFMEPEVDEVVQAILEVGGTVLGHSIDISDRVLRVTVNHEFVT
jgi:hypothetical protein